VHERVSTKERGVDRHEENKPPYETYAIHGETLPLIANSGFKGVVATSGLPQLEDHLLVVEVLTEFFVRKGEVH
jgi:uncharacterized protein (UPF0303 family)